MTARPATLEKIRAAYAVLKILLDRPPTKSDVSRVARCRPRIVREVWEEIIVDDDDPDDEPLPVKVATRRCLSCSKGFQSTGPGNRICPRCRNLERWRQGVNQWEVSF